MTPREKLTKARTYLVMSHPFFGVLALGMKIVEDPTVFMAATDGMTLWFNPKAVDKLPISQAVGLLAHEVLHPAFLHLTRRGMRDPERWNAAGDFVINLILTKSGFDLPPNGLLDEQYDGMSADEVYDKLPKDFCSGLGNNWNWGGFKDAPGVMAQSEQIIKMRVAQATLVAKQSGTLPASIERLLADAMEPVIPWRDILWRFMTEPNETDHSWNRPCRRLLSYGFYMPSQVPTTFAMQDIVVVIDTSGSISEEDLQEFAAELNGIHRQVRPRRTVVMYCDAAVGRVDEFSASDELEIHAIGGGGTDFRPPFKYVEDAGYSPKCLVYLTDGYGPFPAEPPPYPTLWAINSSVRSPFGETLPIHKM